MNRGLAIAIPILVVTTVSDLVLLVGSSNPHVLVAAIVGLFVNALALFLITKGQHVVQTEEKPRVTPIPCTANINGVLSNLETVAVGRDLVTGEHLTRSDMRRFAKESLEFLRKEIESDFSRDAERFQWLVENCTMVTVSSTDTSLIINLEPQRWASFDKQVVIDAIDDAIKRSYQSKVFTLDAEALEYGVAKDRMFWVVKHRSGEVVSSRFWSKASASEFAWGLNQAFNKGSEKKDKLL